MLGHLLVITGSSNIHMCAFLQHTAGTPVMHSVQAFLKPVECTSDVGHVLLGNLRL